MARKYISLLLVGLFLLHLAGFYIYFVIRLGDVRMTMRQQLTSIPDNKLERITVPIQTFQPSWLDGREMEWAGKMYEVARAERHGDQVTIFCLRDMAEDNLLEFISAVVEKSAHDKNSAPSSLVQFFTLKFVVAALNWGAAPFSGLVNHQYFYSRSNTSVDLIPVTPPPRG